VTPRNLILGVFVVATVILSAATLVLYGQVSRANGTTTTTTVTLTTVSGSTELSGQQVIVEASRSFGQVGEIVMPGVGTFDFRAANYTTPNTFRFENVTFTAVPQVTTGALCAEFKATLQNGSSYSLEACSFDLALTSLGIVQQTVISFTKQAVPQAGLMFLPDRTVYVLVRAPTQY
jgi:imidazoleglycerol phosphate synthase glutamine amidotransferase subunit HisH